MKKKKKKCWTWGKTVCGYPNSRNSHVLLVIIHIHVQAKLLHLASKSVHKIPWLTCLTSTQIKSLIFQETFFFFKYRFSFLNPTILHHQEISKPLSIYYFRYLDTKKNWLQQSRFSVLPHKTSTCRNNANLRPSVLWSNVDSFVFTALCLVGPSAPVLNLFN